MTEARESAAFAGSVALVTGAARGMGRATAVALAARGADVAVNDIDPTGARSLVEALGPSALALPGDISDRSQVAKMIERVMQRFGRLDILVNNAGILFPTRLAEISEDEWRRTLDVNLTGTFFCTQAAAEPMKEGGYGRIINVASTAGKTVSTLGGAHYTASKHGILGLTRAAALELAPHGVTVNAVCPGLIDTEMVRETAIPERIAAYAESFPISRLGTPDEVAALICFLASEAAGYITGAAYDITGGDLMV